MLFSSGISQQQFFYAAIIIGLVTAIIKDKFGWLINMISMPISWIIPCGINSSILSVTITGVLGGVIGSAIGIAVFKIT